MNVQLRMEHPTALITAGKVNRIWYAQACLRRKSERKDKMNESKTIISLELLILNDLLRSNTIDKDMYDKAAQKILAANKTAKD